MSSFFSCIGKKSSKKHKKKDKQPLEQVEKENKENEIKPTTSNKLTTELVEDTKNAVDSPKEEPAMEVAVEEAKESDNPLLKELHAKFEKMDKSKLNEYVLERQDSKGENTSQVEVKHNLPKNFAKTAMENVDVTEINILRTRLAQVEKANETLRATVEQLKEIEKAKKTEAEKLENNVKKFEEENAKLLQDLEVLKEKLEKQQEDKKEDQATTAGVGESEDDAVDNAKVLEAIGHLERVCSSFEPGIEKSDKIEDDKLIEINVRLAEVEKGRECIKENAMHVLHSLQEMECRVLRLEVNKEEDDKKKDVQLVKRLSDAEESNQMLGEELGQLIRSYSGLEGRIDVVEEENNFLVGQIESLKADKCKLHIEIENILSSKTIVEEALAQAEKSRVETERKSTELQSKVESFEKEMSIAKKTKQKFDDLVKEFNNLSMRYSELQTEKSVVPNTVESTSSERGSVNGAANGTSDEAIMDSISQRFQEEVFGHQWQEAYKKLTKVCKREEKKTLQILMDFCTEGYLHCRRLARGQIDMIWNLLCNPSASHVRGGLSRRASTGKNLAVDTIPDTLKQIVMEFRKEPTKHFLDNLYEDFLSQLDYEKSRHLRNVREAEVQELSPYVHACLELCWLMVVQDPPMYLQFKVRHGAEMDKSRFKCYGKEGNKIDYLVWPALLTEENGQLLMPGVIQAIPEKA